MGTEGIDDRPPVDDYFVLQPRGPIELQGAVKEAGVPQGRQGQQDARPAPVGELTGDGDVVRLEVIVEEVDGEPLDQRRAHGTEQPQEILQLVLQVLLRDLLEALPPGRKAQSGPIVLPLHDCATPSRSYARVHRRSASFARRTFVSLTRTARRERRAKKSRAFLCNRS